MEFQAWSAGSGMATPPRSGLEIVASGKTHSLVRSPQGFYTATIYPGPKNNFVFNAATIWWADGLEQSCPATSARKSTPVPGARQTSRADHREFARPDARCVTHSSATARPAARRLDPYALTLRLANQTNRLREGNGTASGPDRLCGYLVKRNDFVDMKAGKTQFTLELTRTVKMHIHAVDAAIIHPAIAQRVAREALAA